MILRLLRFGLLAGLAPILPLHAVDRLAERSPFLPPERNEAPVVTENPPLELRGIMGEGESRLFNIYNPATKQSSWVSLNETGRSFLVRSHDASADTVSIDYAGRPVVLKLAKAKISAMTETRPAVSTGPVPMNVQPAVLPRQPTAEQQRQLENVAAEVERRRQLRSQMTNPTAAQKN
jgi:hypothetical protein